MALDIKLTQFSIAGGCGCKVPNNLVSDIVKNISLSDNKNIISDFRHNEDSAIVKINDDQYMVYSVDFFTPIVDDPELFGRIAAANALSDIYAKGAQPAFALSVLGFPHEFDNTDVPGKIIAGANKLCDELNVSILGGHTIHNPQVFFGLSVVGFARKEQLKFNNTAKPGDLIYMTKPLGTGVMSTAQKKGSLFPDDELQMLKYISKPNTLGAVLGNHAFVNCMTDITGFGLVGHLSEICDSSNVSAKIKFDKIKLLPNLEEYIEMGIVTKGGQTNWDNNRHNLNGIGNFTSIVISDPQSNGGLLITVDPAFRKEFEEVLVKNDLADFTEPIGEITMKKDLLLDIIM
jgi:selenide,water dikinase